MLNITYRPALKMAQKMSKKTKTKPSEQSDANREAKEIAVVQSVRYTVKPDHMQSKELEGGKVMRTEHRK